MANRKNTSLPPDGHKESVADKHAKMVSAWRELIRDRAPSEADALGQDEIEEIASMLDEGYQEALISLSAQGLGSRLEHAARESAFERLGDWDELLAKLARRPDVFTTNATEPSRVALPPPTSQRSTVHSTSHLRPSSLPRQRGSFIAMALSDWFRPLKLASRSLWRARAVAIPSILVLSLGLGAAVSLFSLFQSIILDDLEYTDVDRLGVVRINALGRVGMPRISASNVIDFRESAKTISELHLANFPKHSIGEGDNFALVRIASVDAGLPAMLGVRPAMGRLFDESLDVAEEGVGNVLLTHELWVSRYSADPNIVGKSIPLAQKRVEVVGVLKPGQTLWLGPSQSDNIGLWSARSVVQRRGTILRYSAYIRLAQGIPFSEAGTELQALADRGRMEDGEEGERPTYQVVPLMEHLTEDSRSALSLLFGASVFVLLLACINVAGLLAARSLGQRPEWALRAALGASRARLLLGGLIEGFILAAVSSMLGLAMTYLFLQLASRSASLDVPRFQNVAINREVLLFAVLTTVVTALLAGLLPAWRASKSAFSSNVRAGRGGIAGTVSGSTPLVVAQVALALILLAGTGVLLRTLAQLQRVELGYQADQLLTFDFSLNSDFAGDFEGAGAARLELNQTIVRQLEELPEVESVSLTNQLPLGGQNLASYSFDEASRQNFGILTGSFHRIFPRYFETMGITLREGREFTETDMKNPNASVVVSDYLAASAWPDESAIGKHITIEFATANGGTEPRESRVIGVVSEVREVDLRSDQSPQAYLAYGENSWAQDFVVRTHVPPSTLVPKINHMLSQIGPGLVVDDAEAFADRVSSTMGENRLALTVAAAFSVLALVIASLGIYASMAQRVTTRTREIGLRTAMGAQRSDLINWVMQRGLIVTGTGICLGLLASLALLRLLDGFVFGVSPRDPVTLLSVCGLLFIAAIAACWLPAHRASRVDPAIALASE